MIRYNMDEYEMRKAYKKYKRKYREARFAQYAGANAFCDCGGKGKSVNVGCPRCGGQGNLGDCHSPAGVLPDGKKCGLTDTGAPVHIPECTAVPKLGDPSLITCPRCNGSGSIPGRCACVAQ